jgi:hypothetical protein
VYNKLGRRDKPNKVKAKWEKSECGEVKEAVRGVASKNNYPPQHTQQSKPRKTVWGV